MHSVIVVITAFIPLVSLLYFLKFIQLFSVFSVRSDMIFTKLVDVGVPKNNGRDQLCCCNL